MGKRFFDGQLPQLIASLESIATSLEKLANPIHTINPAPDATFHLSTVDGPLGDVATTHYLINQVPVLSTSHMRQRDNEVLMNLNARGYQDYLAAIEGGFFIYLGGADYDNVFWNEHVSPELTDILGEAAAKGCNYIRFDQDGPRLTRYPTFDW